jgi:hypothetical protein
MLTVAVISSPDGPDRARGLLEILRADMTVCQLGEITVVHSHSFASEMWPGAYLSDREVRVPARDGNAGLADRLNAAVLCAADMPAETLLVVDADLWPLRPVLLAGAVRRLVRTQKLLAAASMQTAEAVPAGGLWPGLFAVDLAWQRARRMFPLNYVQYRRDVMRDGHAWQVPSVARCMSAAYFAAVTRDLPEDVWRPVATDRLARLSELEPVLLRGEPQAIWHAHGLTRDPRPGARADLVRRMNVRCGPTLRRLAADDGIGWFDAAHRHPRS